MKGADTMKKSAALPWVLVAVVVYTACLVFAPVAFAQAGGAAASAVPVRNTAYSMGLFDVIRRSGLPGVLTWAGILLWSLASWPLGIVSIVQSARAQTRQIPLATKLLPCGVLWLIVLGGTGAAQGMFYGFSTLGNMQAGAAQQGMLALNISHALMSLTFALGACLHYVFFITISIIIIHFKRKKMPAGS